MHATLSSSESICPSRALCTSVWMHEPTGLLFFHFGNSLGVICAKCTEQVHITLCRTRQEIWAALEMDLGCSFRNPGHSTQSMVQTDLEVHDPGYCADS